MIGAGVDDPDVASGVVWASAADAPDFRTLGMLEDLGEGGASVNLGDGAERDEVENGYGAVGAAGNVSVEMQAGTKEGRAMLAKKDDDQRNEKNDEDEVDTEVFGARHWSK